MTNLESINEIFKTYAPLLDGADKVIGIFISIGLFWLAHRANAIAKSNLELAEQEKLSRKYRIGEDERAIFRSCYSKISEALGLVLKLGRVTDEAKSLFWQARDQARLELPKDIQEYSQEVFDKMWEAYLLGHNDLASIENGGLPIGEERKRASARHGDIILSLINEKPYDVFSKYMKVNIE